MPYYPTLSDLRLFLINVLSQLMKRGLSTNPSIKTVLFVFNIVSMKVMRISAILSDSHVALPLMALTLSSFVAKCPWQQAKHYCNAAV